MVTPGRAAGVEGENAGKRRRCGTNIQRSVRMCSSFRPHGSIVRLPNARPP